MKNTNRGIPRLIDAARFSFQGFKSAYRSEEAFRIEVWLFVVLFPVSFFIADTPVEWLLLIGALLLLMLVELLNSSIESVVDRIGEEWHELSGKAKDMGSAAVLLATVNAKLIWIVIAVSNLFFND